MDYSFVRKLVKNLSNADAKKVYQKLTSNGIEVFLEKDKEYFNAMEECLQEQNDLYVSAADVVFARTLVEEIGLEQHLCKDEESISDVTKTQVELAEEEFYRKHKQNQIFAWGMIVLVIIFLIFQFFN